MKITVGKPPNIADIEAVFGKKAVSNAVFCYGDTIYQPRGGTMPGHLLAHEMTHIKQQSGTTPEEWWKKYLTDQNFRLEQEVEAYQAQYKALFDTNRKERRFVLKHIISDLAGPMYGKIIDKAEAERLITQ